MESKHYRFWGCLGLYRIYEHGLCFAMFCFGLVLVNLPMYFRVPSLSLELLYDCRNASGGTLKSRDKQTHRYLGTGNPTATKHSDDDFIKWKHFALYWPFAGEFTGRWRIPLTKPVSRSFGVSFDLCLNKRLSRQSRRRWFETHRAHHDVTVLIKNPVDTLIKLTS